MKQLLHFITEKRIVALIVFTIVAISAFAEPSGRGADMDAPATSLHYDLSNLIIGLVLLALGGGAYFLRNKHKVFEVLFYIFLVIGGLFLFLSGWSLVDKFLLFPVFYFVSYLIRALLYIAIVLLPFVIFYFIGRKISNKSLRYAFYIIMAGLIILGEYYIICELDAYKLFPKWNFMEEFNAKLYPVEEDL